jgi:hypothetical protein
MCELGADASTWRLARLTELEGIAQQLRPLSAQILLHQSIDVAWAVGENSNPAFTVALLEARGWPDSSFVADHYVRGVQMIGDIPRAGLWRERHPTAMRRDSTEYVPWQELMRTNGSYLNRLVHSMESQFAAAVKRGDEEWLQKNRDVWKASCEERDVHRTARGPFTRSWLDKKYGYGMTRPIPRFGVLQGESGRVTMRHVRCIMRPPGATKWWQTCHTICKRRWPWKYATTYKPEGVQDHQCQKWEGPRKTFPKHIARWRHGMFD